MHLADAFIQSDVQCIQVIHVLSTCVLRLTSIRLFNIINITQLSEMLDSDCPVLTFWGQLFPNNDCC